LPPLPKGIRSCLAWGRPKTVPTTLGPARVGPN